MRLPPGMRARRGPFGLIVVEVPRSTRALLLPRPRQEATPEEPPPMIVNSEISIAPRPAPEPTAEQLRATKEHEALHTAQPWGWMGTMSVFGAMTPARVYMSVTGPRWRCCSNAFDDEHAPWCSAEGFSDPFPPA